MIMCTVIPDCDHRHSGSSGVTAEGFLATFAVFGSIAIGGAIFQAAWVPIGVAILTGWICVTPRLRRVVFAACALTAAGVLWLARLAFRRRNAKPSRTVALPREYQATLYLTGPDGRRAVLGRGAVPGQWTSAGDVEAEIIGRYMAIHGSPAAGELGCHAQPRP